MKRKGLWIFVIAAAALALYFVPIPVKKDYRIYGIEYTLDGQSDSREVAITINGTHYIYAFQPNRFDGRFAIEGYPITEDGDTYVQILFSSPHSFMTYERKYSEESYYSLGTIVPGKTFEEFVILLDDNKTVISSTIDSEHAAQLFDWVATKNE